MMRKTHDRWLARFQEEVLPLIVDEFRPSRVLIFGSRAKGDASEESDIDVIIVSVAFEDIPFLKRIERILQLARFPKHVDYLCYTPEEFERARESSSIIEDAIQNSIEAVL